MSKIHYQFLNIQRTDNILKRRGFNMRHHKLTISLFFQCRYSHLRENLIILCILYGTELTQFVSSRIKIELTLELVGFKNIFIYIKIDSWFRAL